MLKKIIDIAIRAGEIVMKIKENGFQAETKSDLFDFLTLADIESEKYIIKRLSEEFPNDSIISEERGVIKRDSSRIWMVDPLDGTKDFKNGGDGFSIMIGLSENGKSTLGVVYAPAKDLLYFSQKGQGSYVRINGRDYRLEVSKTKYLESATMVTRIPHGEKREEDKIEELFIVKKRMPESSVGIKLGLIAHCKSRFSHKYKF